MMNYFHLPNTSVSVKFSQRDQKEL